MKLIIDIPYEAYYTFKSDLGKGNLNALAEIVANGKPYEERPQGDSISREALKKEVTEKVHFTTVDGHIVYHKILKLIDSASPVPQGEFNLDELCRLRSDLKTGAVVGSTLRYQYQIDRYIKAIDDVIGEQI